MAEINKPDQTKHMDFTSEVRRRHMEYLSDQDFRVYCATWNVNSADPIDIDLSVLLQRSEIPPDIYAVALQEIAMDPGTIIRQRSDPDESWINAILDSLCDGGEYEELRTVRLVGMMLIVAVRVEVLVEVRKVAMATVATGIMNVCGNKGGVGIRFSLHNQSFCFVNSHLAAHDQEFDRRNQDYKAIEEQMMFTIPEQNEKLMISEHDFIFWMGDLNYRIISESGSGLPTATFYGNFEEFETFKEEPTPDQDQLSLAREKGLAFSTYKEGSIEFQQTYKYIVGTDDFTTTGQRPAWCDRILWKGDSQQLAYSSEMSLKNSDHKPVYALFRLVLKVINQAKLHDIVMGIVRFSDRVIKPCEMQVSCDKIIFENVKVNERVSKVLKITNCGSESISFTISTSRELGKDDVKGLHLEIASKQGQLLPGKEEDIVLTLAVENEWLRNSFELVKSTLGRDISEQGVQTFDILNIQDCSGSKWLIPIEYSIKPSFFGLSLSTLSRLKRPVSKYTWKELFELEKLRADTTQLTTIPKELYHLINFLKSTNPNRRWFHEHANMINRVRDWIDEGGWDLFRKFVF